MKIHPTITEARVMDAVERHMHSLDDPGFCIACIADAATASSRMRAKYMCEVYARAALYGAEELMMHEACQ